MPECGYCKDCKHWGSDDPEDIDMHSTIPEGYRECERAKSGGGEPDDGDSTAVAFDGDGYHATLMTAPEHGCVMFEPKP
jgi:hypothetical protein